MQPIFDGHNDVLIKDDLDRFASGREGGHLDLPRMRAGGLAGGVFAVFTPTPRAAVMPAIGVREGGAYELPLAEPIDEATAAAHATRAAAGLFELERNGVVRVCRRAGEIAAAREDGVLAAVLHLEGAEAIGADLGGLELWHRAGLRSLGPVWSRPNAFGHGVPFAFPGSPDTGPGLTERGKELVGRCAGLGIAVDTSHLNEAGFWDVARLDAGPLIASHSGVHAICASTRNLTDEQLDAIGASGGLAGIVFAPAFVRADGRNEVDTPLSTIVAHVRHVAERIGVEHVALGSDFDGATMPAALQDAAGLPRLLDELRASGFTDREVERIAWANWQRVLEEWWR